MNRERWVGDGKVNGGGEGRIERRRQERMERRLERRVEKKGWMFGLDRWEDEIKDGRDNRREEIGRDGYEDKF